MLAKKFAVSFEAVRRILHSKYDPRVQGRGSTAAALEREKEPTAAEREAAEREERRAMAEATSERHRLQSWSPPLVNSSSPSSTGTGTGTISPQAQDHAKQLEYSYRLGDMRMKDTLERLRRQEDAEKSKAAADKRLLRLQGQAQEVEHRQPRQQQPQPGQQPRWPRAEQSKRPSQSEQQGQGQQRWWGQQHHQQDEERSGSNDSGNRARLQQDEERSGSNGNDREQKLDDRRRREKYENAPPRKLWWGAEDSQQQPPGDEQRTVARTGSSPRRQQGRPPPQKDEDRRQLEEGTSSRGKPREPPRFALQAKEERSGNKTSAPLRKTSKPLPVKGEDMAFSGNNKYFLFLSCLHNTDEDDDEDEDEDEDNRHQLEERRPSLKFTGDISRHKDDELELRDSTGRRVVLNENNSLGDRSGQQRSRPKTEVSLGPMHRNDMFGDNPVTRPKKFMSKLWQEGSSGGTTDAGGAVAGEQQQSPQLRNLAVLNSRDRRRLERGNEPTSKNQHLELVEILPSVLIEMQAAEKAAKEAAEAAGAADPATADTAAKEAA